MNGTQIFSSENEQYGRVDELGFVRLSFLPSPTSHNRLSAPLLKANVWKKMVKQWLNKQGGTSSQGPGKDLPHQQNKFYQLQAWGFLS